MTTAFLSIISLNRRLATGAPERLLFEDGVNLLVGSPNTGKTKWLETLDYLFGEPGTDPFEDDEDQGLAAKYDAASAQIRVGEETFWISRRWKEAGGKGKIYVDQEPMLAKDFQHWLFEKLGIPLLHFPKGNPMSGQTWPELSFRMLLRHIYRRQGFWTDLADRQPEAEQLACILQFAGLAEHVFSEDYGTLVEYKLQVERLKIRRENYALTLNELARELLADGDIQVDVSTVTIAAAQQRLEDQRQSLLAERDILLSQTAGAVLTTGQRSRVAELGVQRAATSVQIEDLSRRRNEVSDRLGELQRYRSDLAEEIERMTRAADAGAILSDLRITHCPACDQMVKALSGHSADCFLCHQHLPAEPIIDGMGAVRLRFESDRLAGELAEADELLAVISREADKLYADAAAAEKELVEIDQELRPARSAIAALADDRIGAIDMRRGQLDERERQLVRVSEALDVGMSLTSEIVRLEKLIEPLETKVAASARAIDFDAAAAHLEDGMNAYLEVLNHLQPNTWRHNRVRVELSSGTFRILVGRRLWSKALGGTDSLYFLMAYHYGLLTLSTVKGAHYPGLVVIDVPGDFLGEKIGDKENFIVQPFINMLAQEGYAGAQLIITGASFEGLTGVHFQHLKHVHIA